MGKVSVGKDTHHLQGHTETRDQLRLARGGCEKEENE